MKKCKAPSLIKVPADIAAMHDFKTVLVGEVLRVYNRGVHTYLRQLQDPGARVVVDGVTLVADEDGQPVGYVHQQPRADLKGKKSLKNHYTCGCCRCRGLPKGDWCNVKGDCCPESCWRARDRPERTTLEKYGLEKVMAQWPHL